MTQASDLPEGTEVELTPEREALESALGRSAAQLARNDVIDADEVLRRLAGELNALSAHT